MKPQTKLTIFVFLSLFLISCSTEQITPEVIVTPKTPVTTQPTTSIPPTTTTPVITTSSVPTLSTTPITNSLNYLALGDSYTIGQSVCNTCNYPQQLKIALRTIYPDTDFALKIIATTGWTTTNLISAIKNQNLESNYDLVTLLIGVNNQYQQMNFRVYQKEFPELLDTAIALAKGNNKNVIVLSIPDYAYTPYAKNFSAEAKDKISSEIDQYNSYAESICLSKQVQFISITDIMRDGLKKPNLVAPDGLHPSETAYKMFVESILPKVKMIFKD